MTGTPYSPRSNNPIFATSELGKRSFNKPATTKFVEVPINVQVPPNILAKLSGTSNCCGETPIFLPHLCTIGIITATTGVLFKKADMMAMGSMRRNCAAAVDFGRPRRFPIYQSSAPV
eukprot:552449-Ditylum_brightwellii.AAC.1